jgi:hypothetical protein
MNIQEMPYKELVDMLAVAVRLTANKLWLDQDVDRGVENVAHAELLRRLSEGEREHAELEALKAVHMRYIAGEPFVLIKVADLGSKDAQLAALQAKYDKMVAVAKALSVFDSLSFPDYACGKRVAGLEILGSAAEHIDGGGDYGQPKRR